MIRLWMFLALLATPAGAQTARILSGEHGAFTRIVVELPEAVDWQVGRTETGYAFVTGMTRQPEYDLSRAWTRITRSRLQTLRVDAESGALQLMLACTCHVLPFEYRPGTIVLDIKNGPAPAGSVFEIPLKDWPGLAAIPRRTLAPPVGVTEYTWLDADLPGRNLPGAGPGKIPLVTGAVSLDPLRNELLRQISRGAAEGVVDMTLPRDPASPLTDKGGDLPWSQIHIGEMPGIAAGEDIAAQAGAACLPESALAIADWGAGRPALDLLAEARAGLYSEFDTLDQKAALRAIRLHLYLGFGAEAGQYGRLLQAAGPAPDVRKELDAYLSMARLIDEEPDPATPFAAMLGCDGAAALWAALAHSSLPVGRGVNADAVVRSFYALPPHLRRHLGPGLADRLQRAGHAEAALKIRNAVERTPEVSAAEVAQIDARADLYADRPAEALIHAEKAAEENENNPEALTLLVEAHFLGLEPLSADTADALRAHVGEGQAWREDPAMQRSLVLALALSGNAEEAFAMAGDDGTMADLWRVAARLADDDTFLRHAVLLPGGPAPTASADTKTEVARRLVNLGFADAALAWLGPVGPGEDEDRLRLAATAELARGGAGNALQLLSGLSTREDALLRAQALTRLGDLASAGQAYALAEQPEEAARLLAWENDWTALERGGSGPWVPAAAATDKTEPPDAGPLARGAALLANSAEARSRLQALLSAVPPPQN